MKEMISILKVLAAGLVMVLYLTVKVYSGENPVLFQDNFSDPSKTKEIWQTTTGPDYYDLKDGVLHVKMLDTGNAFFVGDDEWKDYIFSAKIRFIERGGDGKHSGFHIRWNKKSGGVQIIGRENKVTYNISGVTTETVENLDQEKLKIPLNDGKWHYFRFICKGSTINVWADGEEIGTIKNVPLNGGIGLYVGGCIVEFDDIMVTMIDKEKE